MKCSIVKDLLNLYVDDLCSEENNTLIKKHLDTCDKCKETYNNLLKDKHKDEELLETKATTNDNKMNSKQPDDNDSNNKLNPFKKIRAKLVIRYLLNVILSLIIIFMLCLIGMYTYCVINQEEGTKDLNTYLVGKKAKKVTKQLLTGNIDEYVDSIDLDCVNDRYISNYTKMLDDTKDELKKEYNKNLKDKNFELTVNNSFYTSDSYRNHTQKYIQVFVVVTYGNNDVITFSYHFYNNYNYFLENVSFDNADSSKTINFKKTAALLESLVDIKNNLLVQQNIIKENFFANSLDEDYQSRKGILKQIVVSQDGTNKRMYKKLVALFDKGVKIDSCSINNLSYNTDKKHIDGDLILIMSDSKNNKWTLIQPVYYNIFTGKYTHQMICKDKDAEIIGDVSKSVEEKELKEVFR